MKGRLILFFLVLLFITSGIEKANSQENSTDSTQLRKGAVNIFLDCRTCDMNYTRQEIPYVNYVRDVKEADVFILVTTQNAGSGGNQYTYTFSGQYNYSGMNDTLTFTSNPNQTSTEIRAKRTNLMKMGLMRYVARTPLAGEIDIRHNSDLEEEEVIDRWNYWVFELQTSPRFNAEKSYSRFFFQNEINISRVTPDIKFELRMEQSQNRQRFTRDDGSHTTYIRKNNQLDGLLVKSINSHWSAGLTWQVASSTNSNYDLNVNFLPAIEYDIYPYEDATHRQLRILYSAGYQFSDYIDTTITNKVKESLFKHELRIAYQVQEKWGSVNISLTGSNYFHAWSNNRLELNGFINLRIVKGLRLSVNGGVAYINDQLNLVKGNLTEAERLLRLKEQATNFSIQGGLSLTYTFGSIYNNVVNPRFGRMGGGGGGGGGGFGGGGF